jgi:threonine dehydrogenase-like Zn-dependent dehydrogenase
MAAVLIGCGGFLLAVLWMDLLFDVQARRLAGADAGASTAALASIVAYYRRATIEAFPMNRLIAIVMLVQLFGIAYELLTRTVGGARALAVLVLGVVPIGLALGRIVPDAMRLAAATDPETVQADLARRIYHAHVACFVAIAAFTAIQIQLAR